MKSMNETMIINGALAHDGTLIKYIQEPTIDMQLRAVMTDGGALKYIEHPSEAIQLKAVEHFWGAISYIKDPTETMQIAAVKQTTKAMFFIKHPTQKVIDLLPGYKDKWADYYARNQVKSLENFYDLI